MPGGHTADGLGSPSYGPSLIDSLTERLRMANWYYRQQDDEIGPVPPEIMRDRVADGTIVATTRVRREDSDWMTADRVPGLLGRSQVVAVQNEGDATGGLIPYKNVPALVAYYLGIFSLVPCLMGLGILLGAPAIVCGVIGLKKRRQNPVIKGSAHAWIGIILGSITSLVTLAGIGFLVFAALNAKSP